MSNFTKNLQVTFLGVTNDCRVDTEFSFYSSLYPIKVTIREGFITDLGSIPNIVKGVVRGSENRYNRAYVIHDGMYRKGYDRKISDDILDEALKVLGMGWYTRSKIYYPLRLFGSPTTDEVLIANASRCVTIETFEFILRDKNASTI